MEPADTAWTLEAGSDLVAQLHMLPSGKPEVIQPSIGLFFTDTPPTHVPLVITLQSKTIEIPAGKQDYTIEDSYVLPADIDVLSVYPHAHYLATDMKGFATLPDGSVTWLLWIKAWDFNWQDTYRYAVAALPPQRHDVDDALHLRQLGPQSQKSQPPGPRGSLGTAIVGRDGRLVARGPASPCRKTSPSSCGTTPSRAMRADIGNAGAAGPRPARRRAGAQLPRREVSAGRPSSRRRGSTRRGAAPETRRCRGAQQPGDRASAAESDCRCRRRTADGRAPQAGRRSRALQSRQRAAGRPAARRGRSRVSARDCDQSGECRRALQSGADSRPSGKARRSGERTSDGRWPSTRRTPTSTAISASRSACRVIATRRSGNSERHCGFSPDRQRRNRISTRC